MSLSINMHYPDTAKVDDLSVTAVTLDIDDKDGGNITIFLNKNNEDALAFARALVVASSKAVGMLLGGDSE